MGILDIQDQFSTCAPVSSTLILERCSVVQPRLSIMIPTYRRPDFLREAIRSALGQTSTVPYEVVVVDNDMTMAELIDQIVREFDDERIRLFRNTENIGMFGNWNRCIELARAEWVSILNDDDLLHDDFVKEAFAVLEKHKPINLLYCRSILMDSRGGTRKKLKGKVKQLLKHIRDVILSRRLDEITIGNAYLDAPSGSLGMIFKRERAIELGGYKPAAFPSADYVFFVMYCLRFGAYRLNRYLADYRIHENETTNPQTGAGFVKKDLELRAALERYVNAPRFLLRVYARLYALKTIKQLKSFWGVDLDDKQIPKKDFIFSVPVMFSFHAVRFTLRTWFRITKYLRLDRV